MEQARAIVEMLVQRDAFALKHAWAREELGRAIGELKTAECHPELGILRRIELGG